MASRPRNHLRKASAIAAANRVAHRLAAPHCQAIVHDRKGGSRICHASLTQNAVERERDVWWCPKCRRYTDGSRGFPVGHPLRGSEAKAA
jgi:hypothetical protein